MPPIRLSAACAAAGVSIMLLGSPAVLAAAKKGAALGPSQGCVDCHTKQTPNIVRDWQLSQHAKRTVGCVECHGDAHRTATDVDKVAIPTPETCGKCHDAQVTQWSGGKHALAWAAMKAMPTIHYQPMVLTEGLKGCGGCHKIGAKTPQEIKDLRRDQGGRFGVASCDSCHTRHTFSLAEARSPQACQTCHMGFDHAQWEMWSSSKHGVRASLKQLKVVPESAPAPTCQTCHMQEGNHGVMTGWGFLAVRLPMPEDKQWAADHAAILQALGVLDPSGKPTARLEVVKGAKVARLTQEEWQGLRDQMVKTCNQCHSINFARDQLAKGDMIIKDADHVVAEAIRMVAALYKDGILKKPAGYGAAFPDVLTFHDAPTVIEQRLFVMMMEHRMRAFQGSFHNSPDYELWYGWSEMKRDLTEIREMAADMRARAGKK